MKRMLAVLAANALFATAAHASAFEGEDHTNATLLISASTEDMRAGAKALERHPSTNPALLDLAANMLWLGCKGQRGIPTDAQVALGTALGQSGNARYRDVLTYCADRALHPEVKDGTEEALALLPGTDALQFIGGSLRLYDVSTQLAASVSRDAAKRPPKVLAEVAPGLPIQAVYQRVGLPDSVVAEGEGIIAHYGAGAVPFTPAKEGWRVPGGPPVVAAAPRTPPAPRPRPPVAAPNAPVPPVTTPAPVPTPKPPAATPAQIPAPPPVAVAAPQSPPKPAPAAPKAAMPVPSPTPAPVVARPPPPVQVASPPPAPVAPGTFKAGQVAHLRAGAQVRSRPLADGKPMGVNAGEALTLKSPMTNVSGAWWYVEYQNRGGWVSESDLAP